MKHKNICLAYNDLAWTEPILAKSVPNAGGNNETVV